MSVKYIQPHIAALQGCAGSSWLPFVPSTILSHGCWAFLSSLSQKFSYWVKPVVKTLTAVTFKASWHFCIGNKWIWTSESVRHPNTQAFYYIRLHLSPLKMQMMLLTWRVILLWPLPGQKYQPSGRCWPVLSAGPHSQCSGGGAEKIRACAGNHPHMDFQSVPSAEPSCCVCPC